MTYGIRAPSIQGSVPAETYTLTFTLQRAPKRLLSISFEKLRKMLQQEAIQNPMTVELLYDDINSEYPLWQVTREPAHLPQSRGDRNAGLQPDQHHLPTSLYFNKEDWDMYEIQQSPEIVIRVEHIGKGNIPLALHWIKQKLSNNLRWVKINQRVVGTFARTKARLSGAMPTSCRFR